MTEAVAVDHRLYNGGETASVCLCVFMCVCVFVCVCVYEFVGPILHPAQLPFYTDACVVHVSVRTNEHIHATKTSSSQSSFNEEVQRIGV